KRPLKRLLFPDASCVIAIVASDIQRTRCLALVLTPSACAVMPQVTVAIKLGQDQARDSLTKARVTIHSFRTDLVDQDIQAGLKIAAQNLQAGKDAMVERNHRRVGLGISVIAIGIVLTGLRLYIKKTEN